MLRLYVLLCTTVAPSIAGCSQIENGPGGSDVAAATTPSGTSSDLDGVQSDTNVLQITSDEQGCVIDGKRMTFPETLQHLRDIGNTVVVVEHDEDTMRAADYLIDFGPGPGVRGGEVVVEAHGVHGETIDMGLVRP